MTEYLHQQMQAEEARLDLHQITAQLGALPIDIGAPDFRVRRAGAHGACLFRETPIPADLKDAFWDSYRHNKRAWLQCGASVTKVGETWVMVQWLLPSGELTTLSKARLQEHEAQHKPAAQPTQPQQRKATPQAIHPSTSVWVPSDEYEPQAKLEPVIESLLYEYQRKPARVLLDALAYHGGAFDCSDMGTGKTAQCLAAAICTFRKVAVVCPKSIRSGWLKMARHFGVDVEFVLNYERLRAGGTAYYSPSRGWLMKKAAEEWVLVFDEAHKMKNAETSTAQLLRWAVEQGIPTISASGTMACAPWELKVTGRAIRLHQGGASWEKFLTTYGSRFDKWSSKWQLNDKTAMPRLNREIFSGRMCQGATIPPRGTRVRIADLGSLFPETRIIADAFDVSGEISRKINKAFEEAEERVELVRRQAGDAAAAKQQQAEFMRAWHEAEMAKVPAVVSMVQEALDNERSVAVFMNFNDTREAVMKALKTRCGIYGGQSQQERDRCIDLFQSDRERVIVANLTAGGVGVSLHDVNGNYPRTAILLPNPRANDFKQGTGRVCRAGGKSASQQVVFFAAGTIEETICERVREKLKNIDALNDGWMDPKPTF